MNLRDWFRKEIVNTRKLVRRSMNMDELRVYREKEKQLKELKEAFFLDVDVEGFTNNNH